MADPIEFFGHLLAMGAEGLAETGFFQGLHYIAIAIQNQTGTIMRRKYYKAVDCRFVQEPAETLHPGETTMIKVKPEEGNLNWHMEFDCYYDKPDKDEAWCRIHITKNALDTYANKDDTACWHDCHFSTEELTYVTATPTSVLAKFTVSGGK